MSIAKVQAASNGSASSDNTTVTLSSTPTVGNLLWAYVTYFPDSNYVAAPPSGWTAASWTPILQAFIQFGAWYRVVQSGDGTGYTWNFTYLGSPNAQNNQIILYELSGINTTTPLNAHGDRSATAVTSLTLSSPPTPSVDACYPLSAIGTSGFQTTSVSSSSGTTFTKDVDQGVGAGDLGSAIGTLTSGTSTAINITWAISSALDTIIAVDLIAPAATGQTFLLT